MARICSGVCLECNPDSVLNVKIGTCTGIVISVASTPPRKLKDWIFTQTITLQATDTSCSTDKFVTRSSKMCFECRTCGYSQIARTKTSAEKKRKIENANRIHINANENKEHKEKRNLYRRKSKDKKECVGSEKRIN